MFKHTLLSLLPLPVLANTQSIAPTAVFQEKDGVLAIEAEHFHSQAKTDKRAWFITTTQKAPGIQPDGDPNHANGASGGAYLEILPDTRRSHGDPLINRENFVNEPGQMAVLTYKAHFTNPGRYYCWVRTFSTNTEDNGIHLGLNGTWPESGARMQWTAKQRWFWDSKQRTKKVHVGVFGQIWIDIPKPGLHEIQFSMREDGFEFDKFILTTEKPAQDKPPVGKGPTSSLREGKVPPPFPVKAVQKTNAAPVQPKGRQFPAHWGAPPAIQTMDIVQLPGNYGKGSSTLRNWIASNLRRDQQGIKPVTLAAKDFPLDGGFYLDQGKWLAINPDAHQKAQTTITFPYPSGRYHLTFLGVGENDGMTPHEVLVNDASVLKYTIPLADKIFDASPSFHAESRNLTLNLGDVITVKSAIHSADGKEFSRARWAGLRFSPADEKTGKALKAMKKPAKKLQKKTPKAQGPPLHGERQPNGDGSVSITGTLKQWQPVTLSMDGLFAHELDNSPNPFSDLLFNVKFRHRSGLTYNVPGYFAADGQAAETSAQSGTTWRAHLSPDLSGQWKYEASLTGGSKAIHATGVFNIEPSSLDAPGFYREGRLTYIGGHLLQLSGSKRYFLKAGADAPETLLAYADFDGTVARKKNVPLKTWQPHLHDWKEGDPTWKDGKGKGLIGALNYLAGKGVNAFSFLPYNAGGDGDNVWPFVSRDDKFHYDCSKLDQWNIVFTHAQKLGLFLHFKLQETEMDDLDRGHGGDRSKVGNVPTALDGGDLGPERKLYLRQLVARFGHHLALNWNLGEENTQTTKQQTDMANYLREIDPYDHHLVIHSFPQMQDHVYKPLLGHPALTGASLQNSHLKDCHWQVVKWNKLSREAGHPWAVAFDEPGDASFGMPADPDYPGMPTEGYKGPTVDQTRKQVLWGTLMAGGWGVEYYFGYKLPQNDLLCEDWRSRDQSWDYASIALDFFKKSDLPFWELQSRDDLVGNPKHGNFAYCLAKKGLYLVYLDGSQSVTLKPLGNDKPTTLTWFNPRNGKTGQPTKMDGLQVIPPDKNDWLAIIK